MRWRSISLPSSFFSRFTRSCAVIEPNALPVSPVSSVNDDFQFADPARELFRLVQFRRFARGAFRFQIVELPQAALRHFVGFALRQKKIARVAAAHFHDIRLSAEAGNVFGQNNFSGRHDAVKDYPLRRMIRLTRDWIIGPTKCAVNDRKKFPAIKPCRASSGPLR